MSEREWRFYLDDMIGFAENVLTYSEGFDKAANSRLELWLNNQQNGGWYGGIGQ